MTQEQSKNFSCVMRPSVIVSLIDFSMISAKYASRPIGKERHILYESV